MTADSVEEALSLIQRGYYENRELPPVRKVRRDVKRAPGKWAVGPPEPSGQKGIWYPLPPLFPTRTIAAWERTPDSWSAWHATADGWTVDGARIDSTEARERIRATLEGSGPVIVERRHYRGASAPDHLVLDAFDDFEALLATLRPGDDIWVWSFGEVCTTDNALTHGKQPDDEGRVPTRGAY